MQNLFIAIIQVGYKSLAEEPPKQGDETSDDEIDPEQLDSFTSKINKHQGNTCNMYSAKPPSNTYKKIISLDKSEHRLEI